MTKLLEGIVDASDHVLRQDLQDALAEVDRLRNEIRHGFEALKTAQDRNDKLERVIRNLRSQLHPLHRAVNLVFDEIDTAQLDPLDSQPAAGIAAVEPVKSAVWESWKQRLPGMYPAKFIDALLQHGSLDAGQLAIITGCHRTNIAKEIYKLNKANLIVKNGNRYSLKQL